MVNKSGPKIPGEEKNLPGSGPVSFATQDALRIRIGRIRYSNVTPFFHNLRPSDPSQPCFCESSKRSVFLDFSEDAPAALNEALYHGEIDIAPISSLAYLNHQDQFLLLPDMAIGSLDFSGSVILFSRDRIEGLDQETIALSSESLSSSALLKILLRFKYKFKNSFLTMDSDPEAMLERCKAALVIGDDALFYQPKEFVYRYDLSDLWWNWTGKPFCFSVWAVSKDFAKRYPEEVRWLCSRIQATRDSNLENLEQLLKDAEGLHFMDEKFGKLFGYLFNLIFSLDKPMQEGLELFFRLAHRYGLSPRLKRLEFFKME
ncbi:MAG: hypothetical protein EXS63_03360 [Candidatus Omnitrophica bacterium]|nr:hypothetical protein [Candidatus Omnitrophota bacterium]